MVADLQETTDAINQRLTSLEQCLNCSAPVPPSPSPSPSPTPPPSPPPTRPPLAATDLQQVSPTQSGAISLQWKVNDPDNINRQTGFCVPLGGQCTDTPVGTIESSSSAYETAFTIRGLTKNTSYSCYIVELNNIGSNCSDPLTANTKEIIDEFYRPLGITMFQEATQGPVAWVTDQQLSQLTYCTVDPSTYVFLGCSLFDGVGDLSGPVGIVQHNASNPLVGPTIINANSGTGYFATFGLDRRTGYFSSINGLSAVQFDNAVDIVIDPTTDYAYSMEYQGVADQYKVVKLSIGAFGTVDSLLSRSSQTFGVIRGLALDISSTPKRLYMTQNDLVEICDLDSNGDLATCTLSGATFLTVDSGHNLIVDTASSPKHLYVSSIAGVTKCDINGTDGSLSNCANTGPWNCCTPDPDYAQPYGLYIIEGSSPRRMYVTGSYNQKVYVCDISSVNGDLVNCVTM